MEDKKEIKKPSFDITIKAEIKGVAKIEDNISNVKNVALAMKDYYSQIEFTSEKDVELAVEEKKKVNNFKKEVETYRKNIIEEYKKPIDLFEKTAKETESILKEVYEIMNKPVNEYRDREKQKKTDEVKRYFEEYKKQKNIDFISYENANINMTLGKSLKKAKEEAKDYIDRIVSDLELIESDENKVEILVEYKQNGFNVSNATLTVRNRLKAIEEAKKQEEIKAQAKVEEVKTVEQVTVLTRPKVEVKEETYDTTFKIVNATKQMLVDLKEFLNNGGYEIEE